jgi:large subunit ribosomal protein L6
MKNIFKTHIKIPSNTKLAINNNNILSVKGVLGNLYLNFSFLSQQNLTYTKRKMLYSSFFRSFQKALVGVNLGFITRLVFVGVGFRVEALEKDFIKLKLGFSHFVFIKIPKYMQVVSPKKTRLVLKSIDEQLLKEFSSKICSFKLPDSYKGKGILYKNQILVLKEGKKK